MYLQTLMYHSRSQIVNVHQTFEEKVSGWVQITILRAEEHDDKNSRLHECPVREQ